MGEGRGDCALELALWVVDCGERDFHYFHYLARCTRNTHTHTHRAQTVRFSLIERHFDEILVER